jgi:hypothetical protein
MLTSTGHVARILRANSRRNNPHSNPECYLVTLADERAAVYLCAALIHFQRSVSMRFLAFVLAILALVIMALAEGKVNQQAVDATYRAYPILLHGIFVLLAVFFLAGDCITWIDCLTGFAWGGSAPRF